MAEDYDIVQAIKKIEDELIASMIRNLDHHRAEENELGINWEQWQVKQLEALEQYKERNQKKYGGIFKDINSRIDALITIQRAAGNADQEIAILRAMKKGAKLKRTAGWQAGVNAQFFKINDRKINALIKATRDDLQKAEYAMLRMTNDQYRKVIFSAQMYAASGAATYEKAVDMATKDFLKAGINCVEYKNGARHTVSDYADMSIRTASKRAYLTGEGEKRREWGVSTVIMDKRGNPCPKCLPFVGKVLIDDVWSGGSSKDGEYPLMSSAIAAGLYHPRCKDGHTTYFPGISTPPDDQFSKNELEEIEEQSRQEARQQYAEHQAESCERLAKYSLDEENKRVYTTRAKEWKNVSERDIMNQNQWSAEAIVQRNQNEKIIAGEKSECAILYDSAGRRILYKKGDKHSVNFTKEDMAKMKNAVLTHNHPLGATFSEADINLLRISGLAEIRAVGRDGVYVLKQPKFWAAELKSLKDIKSTYQFIDDSLKDEMEKLYLEQKLSIEDYNIIYQDKIIKQIADRYGLEYYMEEWK